MKYRITPMYSLNATTSFPESNYMLERRFWGHWEPVQMFETEKEAEIEIRVLKATTKKVRNFLL